MHLYMSVISDCSYTDESQLLAHISKQEQLDFWSPSAVCDMVSPPPSCLISRSGSITEVKPTPTSYASSSVEVRLANSF